MPAAKLDEAVALRISESLRPATVDVARSYLKSLTLDPEFQDSYGLIPSAQEFIAAGGEVQVTLDVLHQRNGIVRGDEGSRIDEIDLRELSDYENATVSFTSSGAGYFGSISVRASDWGCEVSVDARHEYIERFRDAVKEVLEQAVDPARLAATSRPFKVFIGHGADTQWKVLQRLLTDSHGFMVEAFESIERAGYTTLSVVEQMVRASTVAVIVMTGEDRMGDGSLRARENVIHELGFCQGALGIDRVIILLEEGVNEPSNIAGLTQIRFAKGSLIDVEDKIVAALNQRKEVDAYSRAGH